MSSHVVVEIAGNATETLELSDGDAVLVGREPEVNRLAAGDREVRTLAVAQPSVSANHLLARRSGTATTLVDLDSRNGSWLRLPPGDRVEVDSAKTLHVRLSAPPSSPESQDGPKEATWISRDDFHTGVVAAVSAWFDELGMKVRVSAVRDDRAGRAHERRAGQLPLENGYTLEVVPLRTVDAAWNEVLQVLWRYLNSQNAVFVSEEETRDEGLVLASPAIRGVHRQIVTAAQRGFRLLIIGASGTGKDGLARCYHRHSRRPGALVAKNCSMLSRELLRAELFGAEQGAFTSAVRRIVGAVEACHGGTLFLDEIGEMSGDVQPLLLTFLDRGEYERMGSYGTVRTADVRLVCATNKDLRAATLRGEFREDLWYRIAGQVVHVPPLRERPEDIEAFLRAHRLEGLDAWTALAPDARALATGHGWHGNFRELTAFAQHLPRDAEPEEIDAAGCSAILDGVALAPRPAAPPFATASPAPDTPAHDLGRIAAEAMQYFAADGRALARWDDVKDCLERYVKPLLFAELSGANRLSRQEDAVIPALASTLDADRGTVVKQLHRYFERFKR
jgi:DNA-binding NtrC family response regulator